MGMVSREFGLRPPAIAGPSLAGTGRGSEGDWRAGKGEFGMRKTNAECGIGNEKNEGGVRPPATARPARHRERSGEAGGHERAGNG